MAMQIKTDLGFSISETLREHGLYFDDIHWIGTKDGSKLWDRPVQRLKLLNLNVCEYEYDEIYISNLVVVGKDWWLEPVINHRFEGLTWKFCKQPVMQTKATWFKHLPGKIRLGIDCNLFLEIKDYSSDSTIGKILKQLDNTDYLREDFPFEDFNLTKEQAATLLELYD